MLLLVADGLMGLQSLNGHNMILITGASKGIGRFLFKRFKQNGLRVIGTYNSTSVGFSEDISDYYKLDVSDAMLAQQMVSSIKSSLTQVVLLNCAGISYNSFAHKADIEQWSRVIDVNLKGSFHMKRS